LLDEKIRAAWDALVPRLVEHGIVTALDQGALAMYCSLWVTWRELERVVARDGFTIPRRAGPAIHPALKGSMEVLTQLRLLGAELGLSPAARSRLRLPLRTPAPSLKVQRFLAEHSNDGGHEGA